MANLIFPRLLLEHMKRRTKQYLKTFRRLIAYKFHAFSPDDLQKTLTRLGIVSGDTLMVHSSFDAFDGFHGKPSDVITVLKACVGLQGLVMMPTLTFSGTAVAYAQTKPLFDVARTPSRMGLLTELFRRMPGVVRSLHPTHSVALWGDAALSVAQGHDSSETPCGQGTPFEALLHRQGKIVLLGVDISSMTFFHFLEEMMAPEWPVNPFTEAVFHLLSKDRDGNMVETCCRLFEPVVSRRRNLQKLVPYLKNAGAWQEIKVGNLKIISLTAAEVEAVVRKMSQKRMYCYD